MLGETSQAVSIRKGTGPKDSTLIIGTLERPPKTEVPEEYFKTSIENNVIQV